MKPQTVKKQLSPKETGDCLFRILFLLQMVDSEITYLANRPDSSQVRTALSRGKKNYEYTVTTLRRALPMANQVVEQHIKKSEGKIAAIANIVSTLSQLSTADVELIEEGILKNIATSTVPLTGGRDEQSSSEGVLSPAGGGKGVDNVVEINAMDLSIAHFFPQTNTPTTFGNYDEDVNP